jgi:hypothetical protein
MHIFGIDFPRELRLPETSLRVAIFNFLNTERTLNFNHANPHGTRRAISV